MKFLKLRFLHVICLLFALNMWAQDSVISGQVTDETGLPVPGASVFVKGTQNGTSTDIDGNYQIQAASNATLVISFVGYGTIEEAVNSRTTINVSLSPSSKELEELVVVGYGVQKKAVVTGAISSVKAKDLENLPLTNVGQTLQGRTSGVFVAQNAGQPGSSATIRVRGITSFNNNDPLWVVDGVIVDNGGMNFLNQSDIESMEVLKDAASQAIYGARAAAGVILITTKKGKAGKLTVNYNGFGGVSSAARKLDLLNATQYATLRNEAYANGYTGGTFQLPFANPAALGAGTNWQDQIFGNAQRQQHEFSLSGGTEKSTFYMSLGLTDQEGIVTSDISRYIRKNIRINSTHKLGKYLTFGENIGYSHEKTVGLGNTNNEFGGPLASAINLDPVTPARVTPDQVAAQPNAGDYAFQYAVKDENGNFYGISPYVANEMSNPLAYTKLRQGNYGWADNFVGNAYLEASLLDGLKLRSTVGGKLAFYGNESFTPMSYLNPNQNTQRNSLYRDKQQTFGWNIENTASYTKMFGGHNVSILVGQAAYVDNITSGTGVTYYNQPVNNHADASFNWPTAPADIVGWASTGNEHIVTSLFARATYDYKEKYLFTGIIRRDGSSRFGSNNKYGTFPSFSLGWVPTKEDFWKENDIVNNIKIRGGYGVTGSDNIGDFQYLSRIDGGRNYTIGTQDNYNYTIGYSPAAPSNPDLKWEETRQTNVGFEATIAKDFSLEFDLYQKKTVGILQDIQLPGYVGATGAPQGNVADMKNSGIDFSVNWRKQLGDFNISVTGNGSTLKNEVTNVGADRTFNTGPGFQSMGSITRYEVGSSINEFYGYVTDGVFQNQAEIDASPVWEDGRATVPGDFKWKDLNGDGKITADDRTYLGSPLPKFTYGLTIDLAYKNFDLKLFGQGATGNKIFQGLRRLDLGNANWQTAALNRWTGEGTSNSYPRLSTSDPNGNFTSMSNFYLQDGDYFRIKIIQLGYSIPSDIIGKVGLDKTRVYVTTENLFTFTKYTGYDPEIGGSVTGIDRGYYPQARSFMMGVNLSF